MVESSSGTEITSKTGSERSEEAGEGLLKVMRMVNNARLRPKVSLAGFRSKYLRNLRLIGWLLGLIGELSAILRVFIFEKKFP